MNSFFVEFVVLETLWYQKSSVNRLKILSDIRSESLAMAMSSLRSFSSFWSETLYACRPERPFAVQMTAPFCLINLRSRVMTTSRSLATSVPTREIVLVLMV